MTPACANCGEPVDFDPGKGGCYVGGKPCCSHACARALIAKAPPTPPKVFPKTGIVTQQIMPLIYKGKP